MLRARALGGRLGLRLQRGLRGLELGVELLQQLIAEKEAAER